MAVAQDPTTVSQVSPTLSGLPIGFSVVKNRVRDAVPDDRDREAPLDLQFGNHPPRASSRLVSRK
ncbi:MAG: hypothetical protein R2882_10465 [Gemmatimonadales bacterium]